MKLLCRPAAWMLLLLAAAVGTGCSSFRRDAKAARAQAVAPGSVAGLWTGRWHKAEDPGHGGAMELVLTRTGETLYRASARSQWWRFFRSAYDTTVVVTPVRPGEYLVRGGKDLWAIGGYTLVGRVSADAFTAEYEVEGHRGVMELKRP